VPVVPNIDIKGFGYFQNPGNDVDRIAMGITHNPTWLPKAMDAAEGQPTSITSRWILRLVTIA
jgi:hypothetical protein